MENKDYIGLWMLAIFSTLIVLAILVWTFRAEWLAWVSVWDYLLATPTELAPTIVRDTPIERKPTHIVKPTPKVEKQQESPKEVKIDTKPDFDLDKLARAVAMAETGNCTKGYGKTHNNCHWIKSWNTYPCPWTPKGKMCKFKNTEESFTAFRVIWSKWYKTLPTHNQAVRWTWADSSVTWRKHVLYFYYQ